MATRSEQVRELREAFDSLASEAWTFYGLADMGGGSFCWKWNEVGGDGFILVSGEDSLASDGAPESFGSWVAIGQYTGESETVREDGDELCVYAYDINEDGTISLEIGYDIVAVVREVFKRWGVK